MWRWRASEGRRMVLSMSYRFEGRYLQMKNMVKFRSDQQIAEKPRGFRAKTGFLHGGVNLLLHVSKRLTTKFSPKMPFLAVPGRSPAFLAVPSRSPPFPIVPSRSQPFPAVPLVRQARVGATHAVGAASRNLARRPARAYHHARR